METEGVNVLGSASDLDIMPLDDGDADGTSEVGRSTEEG